MAKFLENTGGILATFGIVLLVAFASVWDSSAYWMLILGGALTMIGGVSHEIGCRQSERQYRDHSVTEKTP